MLPDIRYVHGSLPRYPVPLKLILSYRQVFAPHARSMSCELILSIA